MLAARNDIRVEADSRAQIQRAGERPAKIEWRIKMRFAVLVKADGYWILRYETSDYQGALDYYKTLSKEMVPGRVKFATIHNIDEVYQPEITN